MKKILILGAGLWQIPYLKKAKEMGLYVIATDWSDNAVGKEYADLFKPISVRDKEESLKFAMENDIDAVFTSTDVGVPTAAYISQKMNLLGITEAQAELATNKFVMRNKIKEIGLKTPLYKMCRTEKELLEAYQSFPQTVIVKPTDNCGSRGVFVVNSKEELLAVSKETFESSFSGQVLLEELMTGIESSVEVLVDNGKPIILGWCKKVKSPFPYRVDMQLDYFPDRPEEENKEVEEMVNQLVRGIEMRNGIMHIEFIWTQDGVKIIEFALRGCGGNVITYLMPALRGYDIEKFLLARALGEDIPVILSPSRFGTLKFIIPQAGKVKKLSGVEEINKKDYVLDFHTELCDDFVIESIKNTSKRPAHVIVIGDSREDINNKLNEVVGTLKIEYYG